MTSVGSINDMILIIGLGNPGKNYAHNRHNVGFHCINNLGRLHGIAIKKRQCQAQSGTGYIAGKQVLLVKPKTYMNLSGKSVKSLVRRYKSTPEDLVVIHDDLDLPLGKIRLYHNGGSGGHRGVGSITYELDSRDFLRIRIGIGRPPNDEDPVGYVLKDFLPNEKPVIQTAINTASESVLCLLTEGIEMAMNRFN